MFKNFEIQSEPLIFNFAKVLNFSKVFNLFILVFFVKESIGEMLSLSILFKNYMSPIL